ncbi:developmentally-regulated protein with ankyrin repeat [Acrasis kona]|uniref:Developmentally-regulated protein with ankyrin repeat n=1 Tax=Acrasis kona TaxID=1008807 RepID=A0AAW2YQS8_9EUKA
MVQKKTNEVETFIFEELFKHLGAHGLDRSQLDTFIEHVSSDGDVLAQFLGCAYDHIYEPDAIIVQEEQNVLKPNQFCLTFRVNLRLLRLRALIVFVCFNLCKLHPDQNECRMWLLEKLKDNVLLLDESLNEVTHASFFDQLRIIEQNLRFETEVQVLQPNSQRNKVHVEVKNGTMNSILLKSSDQDALTASFDQVTLAMQKEKNEDGVSGNSSDEDEDDRCDVLVRPYLLIHIGKYMTFAKYGQNTFKMSSSLASSRPTSSVQEDKDSRLSIVDVSPTKGDANSNTSVRLTWNKEFFVNPKRENTDIYFAVQLGRVKLPRIDALYIDHLKITIPPLQDCYSSSSSSDEEDCASITSAAHIPIQVRHNHLELTTDASFQSIPMESIATSSSSPSPHESFATHHSPSVGNKRTLIHNENSRAMMDDDDIQADLIHDMCGTTISHKRQRLSEDFQDSCSTSDSYTNQSTISNSYKSTTIKSLQKIRDPCGFTLLHSASFRGYTKLVKMLVNVQNFTVDQQDHYLFTPLHWACYSGNVDIAMFLMKNGASPTLQNIFALTAPDIAEEQNHMELWKAMDAELQRPSLLRSVHLV